MILGGLWQFRQVPATYLYAEPDGYRADIILFKIIFNITLTFKSMSHKQYFPHTFHLKNPQEMYGYASGTVRTRRDKK
jgi:hypothetical protein